MYIFDNNTLNFSNISIISTYTELLNGGGFYISS
jgi:hypothetical protein